MAKGRDLDKEFPVAKKVTADCFFLGTFIGLTEEKIDYIEEKLDSLLKGKQ